MVRLKYLGLRYVLFSLIAMLLIACAPKIKESLMNTSPATEALLQKVQLYRNSIIHADDLSLAEQIWATTPEVSFIHPRGHEKGWEEIRQRFYIQTMANTFSKRELNIVTEPLIHQYGDAAVVEFKWDFVATMRDDGSRKHTTGRESQVYVNQPGVGWRLVHVHYSGPAISARGEGF